MPLAPAAVVGSVVQVDRRLWQSSAGGTITASMSRQLRTSLARRGFGFGAWLASCGPGPDSPAALAPLAPLAWPASPLEPLGPCPLFRTPGSAGVCSAMAGYAGPTGRSQCGLGLRRFLHCIFYQMKEAIDDVINIYIIYRLIARSIRDGAGRKTKSSAHTAHQPLLHLASLHVGQLNWINRLPRNYAKLHNRGHGMELIS